MSRRHGSPARTYLVYGLRIRSSWELPCEEARGAEAVDIEIVDGPVSIIDRASRAAGRAFAGTESLRYAVLEDSAYLRWPDLFEFVVSADGARIVGRPLSAKSMPAFRTYLLGQVLSFALLRMGLEPLHVTAVEVRGRVVGLTGDSGYGKSTLAAQFVRDGHRLLTDDLLVMRNGGSALVAYPGPPRLKLFPESMRLLGPGFVGAPMIDTSTKMLVHLDASQVCTEPHPVGAIYALRRPAADSSLIRTTIRTMTGRRAFLELTKNTFNTVVLAPERLSNQFSLAARVATSIPIKSLTYPPGLDRVESVKAAIVRDLPW